MAHYKLPGTRTYFLPVFCGGGITSLCCAQAPNPKAVTNRATIMIPFRSFNLSRLLSPQAAVTRLSTREATFLLPDLDVSPRHSAPDFQIESSNTRKVPVLKPNYPARFSIP